MLAIVSECTYFYNGELSSSCSSGYISFTQTLVYLLSLQKGEIMVI
jgi:hypothetical protein